MSDTDSDASETPQKKDDSLLSFFDFDRCQSIKKWSTVLGAILLAIVGISKVAAEPENKDDKNPNTFVMTLYFIVIGVIMISVEFGSGTAQQWFLFLNFAWGKVFVNAYLICAILGSKSSLAVFEYVVCGVLLVSSCFVLLSNYKYSD